MADFVQTMNDWRRMCSSIKGADCAKCPLYPYVCKTPWQDNQTPWDVVEKRISTWAAEHPEPVYPTWAEWLVDSGVFPQKMSTIPSVAFNTIRDSLSVEIPADIAEKLGLGPK